MPKQFQTQDSWKLKRLPRTWRHPKGHHSKMRHNIKGNPKMPSQGYRRPEEERYMHPSGIQTALVHSPAEVQNASKQGIIIASTVGIKKRLQMLKEAAAKKLKVLNVAENYEQKIREAAEQRKKHRQQKKSEQPSKKTEEPKKSEEDKRKESKKEMEKIITKPK
ncbi:hypothetical protein HYX10_05365 [Candidatus Woesearchaeota archaeon]|nr:hypothetical protein [Candidatus Woesearchaeota archaeon]